MFRLRFLARFLNVKNPETYVNNLFQMTTLVQIGEYCI